MENQEINNNNNNEENNELEDEKTSEDETKKYSEERKKAKMKKKLRKLVSVECKRITKVLVPISICMIIVVFSINFFPIYTSGVEDVVHEIGFTFYERKGAPTSSKIGSAILLAIFFLILLAGITFCMTIVIIYQFDRLIKGFFIFAFIIYFGVIEAIYLFIAVFEYNIAIDWITVLILLYNYTGVGIIAFFISGPKLLKQIYLIILSSNMALILILILPDWSGWVILCIIAVWDIYAVLHKTGPLNMILNSENAKKLPPILYATAIWLQTSSSEDEGEIEIGLGDFVFYSILVGKSFGSGDFLTAIICYIYILVGLAITLFMLILTNMPLPALPISIALGVIANFTTKFFVTPFNDILSDKQIFI